MKEVHPPPILIDFEKSPLGEFSNELVNGLLTLVEIRGIYSAVLFLRICQGLPSLSTVENQNIGFSKSPAVSRTSVLDHSRESKHRILEVTKP